MPKSFELIAGKTKVWVSPNAVKHMNTYTMALARRGVDPKMLELAAHFQLKSLAAAVTKATKNGVVYEEIMLFEEFCAWSNRKRASLDEEGVTAVVTVVNPGNSNRSARIDIDTDRTVARISLLESGHCDLEILDLKTKIQIYCEYYFFEEIPDFNEVFLEFFQSLDGKNKR